MALQVQMGLYGSIRRRAGANEAYLGIPYNQNLDITLLFSEVDADLHDAVAAGNYGPGKPVPSTIHSKPQYYLINGNAYNSANPVASLITLAARPTVARPALLRILNPGQDGRVPVIDRSEFKIIAQDAKANTYPRTQYSAQLPALKTVDVLWTQTSAGTLPSMTGLWGSATSSKHRAGCWFACRYLDDWRQQRAEESIDTNPPTKPPLVIRGGFRPLKRVAE